MKLGRSMGAGNRTREQGDDISPLTPYCIVTMQQRFMIVEVWNSTSHGQLTRAYYGLSFIISRCVSILFYFVPSHRFMEVDSRGTKESLHLATVSYSQECTVPASASDLFGSVVTLGFDSCRSSNLGCSTTHACNHETPSE